MVTIYSSYMNFVVCVPLHERSWQFTSPIKFLLLLLEILDGFGR